MRTSYGNLKLYVGRHCNNVTVAGLAAAGRFINQIQELMAEERDWTFFRVRRSTITMVASQTDPYELPTGFDRVDKVYYKDTNGKARELDPATDDTYFKEVNEGDPGTPQYYRFLDMDSTDEKKPKIQIGPPPDSTFLSQFGTTLWIEQYRDPATLTADAAYPDWPFRFHKIIEWGAAWLMAVDQGDDKKAATFSATYEGMIAKKMLQDENRYRATQFIKPAPWATMYPNRAGAELGVQSDYGD